MSSGDPPVMSSSVRSPEHEGYSPVRSRESSRTSTSSRGPTCNCRDCVSTRQPVRRPPSGLRSDAGAHRHGEEQGERRGRHSDHHREMLHQCERRFVGPLQVVDDEHHRPGLARSNDRIDRPGHAPRAGGTPWARLELVGFQRCGSAGYRGHHGHGCEHGDVDTLDRRSPPGQRSGRTRLLEQPSKQLGLAHAWLTTDDDDSGGATGRLGEPLGQYRLLVETADQVVRRSSWGHAEESSPRSASRHPRFRFRRDGAPSATRSDTAERSGFSATAPFRQVLVVRVGHRIEVHRDGAAIALHHMLDRLRGRALQHFDSSCDQWHSTAPRYGAIVHSPSRTRLGDGGSVTDGSQRTKWGSTCNSSHAR